MLAIGMPGMTEWIIILVIVLIFFGAGKLPDVFAQAGKGIRAFKDASEGKDRPEPEAAKEKEEASPRKQIAKDELDDEDVATETAPIKKTKRDEA